MSREVIKAERTRLSFVLAFIDVERAKRHPAEGHGRPHRNDMTHPPRFQGLLAAELMGTLQAWLGLVVRTG